MKMLDEVSIRENLEREYLGLILNKPFLLKYAKIKPFYFSNNKLGLMYQQILECYEKYNTIDFTKIMQIHKAFDLTLCTDLLTDTLVNSNYEEKFEELEENMLNYQKKTVIKSLNQKLSDGNMTCEDFIQKIKKIDDIQIVKKIKPLDEQEIYDNIDDKNISIKIKKFDHLNKLLKLVQGDFLIVGATTGVGKSGLLLNFMNGLMDNYQCIYFNMEMSKTTIYKRIISIYSGIPIKSIGNYETDYQKSLGEKSIKEIASRGLIIEHKANDIDSIRDVVRKFKNTSKHTILFIDHIGLVKKKGYKSLYESTTEVAKELRQICLDYDCTIISACQLNRTAYGAEQINLSMLKDSGEIENSASKIILMYRDKFSDRDSNVEQMVLEIAKNRDGAYGLIKTNYYKERQEFKELEERK